ncbi:MAG: dihydrofolate reductase family protein [Anaerolineae bacterium]|nr:dihydrofolate reductase family protein [Anaerolineae bacterium]
MGTVIAEFTMSLDGFIADPDDDVWRLFKWYMSGDTPLRVAATDRPFRVSAASAELLQSLWGSIGATVTGRRDFDVSQAWGGTSPVGEPIFIVTHNIPEQWVKPEYPFTFVTDGVESALRQAQQVAGGKRVAISGSKVVQQVLNAGLVDEIQIDLAHMLLGSGIRLFENLERVTELESTGIVAGIGVTHLQYRVIK